MKFLHVHGSGSGFLARPLPFLLFETVLKSLPELDATEVILVFALLPLATSFSVRALFTGGGTNASSVAVTFEDSGTASWVALRRGLLGPATAADIF